MNVGDRVRVVKGTQLGGDERDSRDIGRVGVIAMYVKMQEDDELPWRVDLEECDYEGPADYWYATEDLEVLS